MSMVANASQSQSSQSQSSQSQSVSVRQAITRGPALHLPENSPSTFTEVIAQATDRHPNREIVFVRPDGRADIQTYAALRQRAERLLGGLRSAGLKPGDLVLVYVEDPDFIAAFWGCVLGGFVPVPLMPNLKRQQESAAKLNHALNVLNQPFLLTSTALEAETNLGANLEANLEANLGESLRTATVASLAAGEPDTNWHLSRPEDLVYLVMSSGTTGVPKIVQMTHHIVTTRYVRGQLRKLQADGSNILLNWMPFSHSAGLQVVRPQWDRVIYVQTEAVLQKPLLWLDAIAQYQVTNVTLPNFALGVIADQLLAKNQTEEKQTEENHAWDLSSLRRIAVSTEAIVPRTARQFLELLTPYGLSPHALTPTYSMSEVGAITTANDWSALEIGAGDRFVEVGAPDMGCAIRIVDEKNQPVAEGEIGRIEAHSPVMTTGYYQDAQRTASAFTEDGWFRTGDLGLLQQGQLTVTGRHKELIIINGRNYYSTEIESVVEGVCALEKGYTAACPTRLRENNTDELAVFFHIKDKQQARQSLILKQIRKALNRELGINPNYLIPVEKAAIPKTVSGKIQRIALKKQFESGKFDTILQQTAALLQQHQQQHYVAPKTQTEKALSTIWAALLQLENVSTHDNFFELGGHSLLAAQVTARIRQNLQQDLPLHSLFTNPTIAALALLIDRLVEQRGADPNAIPATVPLALRRQNATTAPLSLAQQRLWFSQRLDPESRAYHLTKALRLRGSLNSAALQQSLSTILSRHEILRTRFIPNPKAEDGLPVQVVDPPSDFELSAVDVSHDAAPEARLQAWLNKEVATPFDLASDRMIRGLLVRLKPDDHVLLLVMHHIVSDGWSMGVLKRELGILYQAYAHHQANPLSALPIQYSDFAQWQRQWLLGETLDQQLNYWKQQLANAPAAIALPTDRPHSDQTSFKGAHVSFSLSRSLTNRLKALSQENAATLYMTLLAAFNTLLYRYTQQADIVVGSPIASRDRPDLENLIGFFVNTLVLRTDLSGNPSFQTLLTHVRQRALDAYAHQNIPFEELVLALKPERIPHRAPWFQVMFVFQNQPLRKLDLMDLQVEPFERQHSQGNAMFDLTLFMKDATQESAEGLSGKIVFKTDLFATDRISRMAGHFQTLLEGIVANPQQPIATLPLLTRPEQQQLAIHHPPASPVVAPVVGSCIAAQIEAQAQKTPNAIALIHKAQQLTYQTLNARANRLAHHLQTLGVGPETLVGLSIDRSVEMVVGLLGILKAGGAYVPLDPSYPQARLAMMMADAKPKAIVTLRKFQSVLPEGTAVVCLDDDWAEIVQQPATSPVNHAGPRNLAYVIFTSGSTGKPKGVMIEQRSLTNFVQSAVDAYGICDRDRVLQFASINFDAAVEEIFSALRAGATLILRTDEMLSSPQHFISQCQALSITVLDLPTAYWHQLTAALPTSQYQVPPALRLVIIGGETAQPDQLHRWQTWIASSFSRDRLEELSAAKGSAKGPQLINTYGPTESTVVATTYKIPQPYPPSSSIPISQGFSRGFANAHIHLLDAHLQPVPIGIPGEIHISGPGLARGYLNQPHLTAARFIRPHGASPSTRLYKTGDMACYLPNGHLKFLGRRDDQVKIRGFRIELSEIEFALSQQASVQQCVVVAREDTHEDAQGEQSLVAYYVPAASAHSDPDALRQHLQLRLPSYMLPSAIVPLVALPLTPNGKIDRKALPKPDIATQTTEPYAAPRTPDEQQLSTIWAEVLKLDRIGIHDNFFALGGHSLLAIQVISRLSQALNCEIPLQLIFTHPTIEKLAEACANFAWLSQGLPQRGPKGHRGEEALEASEEGFL